MGNRKPTESQDPNIKLSRRHFMKYTGTIVFALGTGRYVFAGQIPTPALKQNGIDTKIPSSDPIFDSDRHILLQKGV